MKQTKAVDYALHTLAYMIDHRNDGNISVLALASHFDVSPTYLSKILTQLSKAGIISSTSGVKGGYVLNKDSADINFFEVIQAIEGNTSYFSCAVHEDKNNQCGIKNIMVEADQMMEAFLREKKLIDTLK